MSIENVKTAVMRSYPLVTERKFNLALEKIKAFNNRIGPYKYGIDWEGEVEFIVSAWNYACKKHDVVPIDFYMLK